MAKEPTPTVSVYATCHIVEGGNRYAPGDEIKTTAERAAALGDTVTTTPPAK